MDEIRLINAEELKTDLKQYFSDGTLESVSAKLAFNMILRKIDDAPTVKPERPYVIDNCDMNVFEPEKYLRPEKKIQTPSCLTNPERQAELLERYKEE